MKILKNYFFFLFTFLYSWSLWYIAIILGGDLDSSLVLIFYYLGGIGPSLVGILLVYLKKDKEEVQNFWRRSYDPHLITPYWYLIILIIPLLRIILAILISQLLGGKGATYEGFTDLINNSLSFIPYILFLIIAVLAEEFGWRGYAQDSLQKNKSIYNSALIVGIFWAVWHLPLFFIKGTYQSQLGIGSLGFWLFFIFIIPEALVYAWIFNKNKKSILAVILYHFLGNLFGELFSLGLEAQLINTILTFILALLIVFNEKKSR